ncbi:MAG TPA: hypothetical protein VMU80_03980 [Bryobacteraceae bacterium]|nr:hypothetical protein [Bryobacteraceae bacterium]
MDKPQRRGTALSAPFGFNRYFVWATRFCFTGMRAGINNKHPHVSRRDTRSYSPFDIRSFGLFRHPRFIMDLKIQPKLRRCSQVAREAQIGVGGNSAAAADDFVEASRIDCQVPGKFVDAHVERAKPES